jgi:hypothetical protein
MPSEVRSRKLDLIDRGWLLDYLGERVRGIGGNIFYRQWCELTPDEETARAIQRFIETVIIKDIEKGEARVAITFNEKVQRDNCYSEDD